MSISPTIRVLLSISVVAILFLCFLMTVIYNTAPIFTTSDIHYTAIGSTKLHITATVRSNGRTTTPICSLGAVGRNMGAVAMEDTIAGPQLKSGQTWHLADDLYITKPDVQVDKAKVDCIDY